MSNEVLVALIGLATGIVGLIAAVISRRKEIVHRQEVVHREERVNRGPPPWPSRAAAAGPLVRGVVPG